MQTVTEHVRDIIDLVKNGDAPEYVKKNHRANLHDAYALLDDFFVDDDASSLCALRQALQEFCDRVDRGEIRSKVTYAKFKALLEYRS